MTDADSSTDTFFCFSRCRHRQGTFVAKKNVETLKDEVNKSKQLFKKFNWPTIDVTRKSVEETAASILKILEIKKNQ